MYKNNDRERWNKFWKNQTGIKKVVAIFRNQYFARILSNYINKFKGSLLLEVGCGSASISSRLKVKVVCLDYSDNVLKISRRKQKKNQLFMLGDAYNLPFKDNKFDVVFSQGLIEHFEMPEDIIKEKLRVTKKNGQSISFISGHPIFKYWYKFTRNKFLRFLYPWEETPCIKKKLNFKEVLSRLGSPEIRLVPLSFARIVAIILKKN